VDLEEGLSKEWILGNGLGGYSSSTIIGCNTRKYHGLLVAALEPPVNRRVLLSKLEEEVEVDGRVYELSTNEYPGAVHPQGYRHVSSFKLDPFPTTVHTLGEMRVSKKVFTLHRHNAVVITYSFNNPGEREMLLRARPLITSRGIHELGIRLKPETRSWQSKVLSYFNDSFLGLGCSDGAWQPSELPEDERWYRSLSYRRERERGYSWMEDLYCPGEFLFEACGTAELHILASGGKRGEEEVFKELYRRGGSHYTALYKEEGKRIEELKARFHETAKVDRSELDILAIAADSFIVEKRSLNGRSVIAGYHWFADFGRDTFIALPGLTLVTGRFEDAREILSAYTRALQKGLLPNTFSELDGTPVYNSADAPLWFIYAVQKYLEYTGDRGFVKKLQPAMESIVQGFISGNGLAQAESDCLISIPDAKKAVTWMDVKIDSQPATPRHGKVVELNALWLNDLRFLWELTGVERYNDLAAKVEESFQIFWNRERRCLYDHIHGDVRCSAIMPNQIFSVSLPYSALTKRRARAVVDAVEKELLTPYGLRSLEKGSEGYRPVYEGDQVSRDLAYHHGVVWSWLIGPFTTAYVKVRSRSDRSRREAEKLLKPLMLHIADAGVGSISEIFDAEPPYKPRGCISQAWSVGELLRAWCEDVLEVERPCAGASLKSRSQALFSTAL